MGLYCAKSTWHLRRHCEEKSCVCRNALCLCSYRLSPETYWDSGGKISNFLLLRCLEHHVTEQFDCLFRACNNSVSTKVHNASATWRPVVLFLGTRQIGQYWWREQRTLQLKRPNMRTHAAFSRGHRVIFLLTLFSASLQTYWPRPKTRFSVFASY